MIAVLSVLSSLAACDFIYGVNRGTKLDALPDLDCVDRVIRTTQGIEDVRRTEIATGRELDLSGLRPSGIAYTFIYHGAVPTHIQGVLQLTTNWRGYVNFSQYDYRINAKPPQEEIDNTRPIMREIERRLSSECDISEIPLTIKEKCIGVECKPLGD